VPASRVHRQPGHGQDHRRGIEFPDHSSAELVRITELLAAEHAVRLAQQDTSMVEELTVLVPEDLPDE
jgi:hypothetical protein